MATEIIVPELGESVVEATVSRWLKKKGDSVSVGEAVVELETDKVNLEVSAEQAGVLSHIERQEGEDVEIGDVLGSIDESAEAASEDERDEDQAQKETTAKQEQEPEDAEDTEAEKEKQEHEAADGPEGKATPVARRLAEEHGLDLGRISAAGERIGKEDVERYLEAQEEAQAKKAEKKEPEAAPEESTAPAKKEAEAKEAEPAGDRTGREERSRMSRRRQTIARRLVEAQQTAAMLTTFNEVDMSAVMELRQRRRVSFEERHGVRLGFMSFFVKAAIGALKQFPHLNAEIDGDEIVVKHYYDIGMAVSAEEGLVVPVIREADRLTFADIEKRIGTFAEKAKAGTLSIPDLRGGTFTITNGGVFGSLLSTPILNPPQVGILGLHKIEKRPVVIEDEIVVRPMMYIALSYDHRIVDGAEAVQFLVRVKTLIEEPETLLLEG